MKLLELSRKYLDAQREALSQIGGIPEDAPLALIVRMTRMSLNWLNTARDVLNTSEPNEPIYGHYEFVREKAIDILGEVALQLPGILIEASVSDGQQSVNALLSIASVCENAYFVLRREAIYEQGAMSDIQLGDQDMLKELADCLDLS